MRVWGMGFFWFFFFFSVILYQEFKSVVKHGLFKCAGKYIHLARQGLETEAFWGVSPPCDESEEYLDWLCEQAHAAAK